MTTPPHESEPQRLGRFVDELKTEISELESYNEQLSGELCTANAFADELQETMASESVAHAHTKTEVEELRKLLEAEREYKQLLEERDRLRASVTACEQAEQAEHAKARAALEKDLAKEQAAHAEAVVNVGRAHAMQDKFRFQRDQACKDLDNKEAELHAGLGQAQKELLDARKALQVAEAQAVILKETCADLGQCQKDLDGSNKALEETQTQLEEARKALQVVSVDARKALQVAEAQAVILKETCADLGQCQKDLDLTKKALMEAQVQCTDKDKTIHNLCRQRDQAWDELAKQSKEIESKEIRASRQATTYMLDVGTRLREQVAEQSKEIQSLETSLSATAKILQESKDARDWLAERTLFYRTSNDDLVKQCDALTQEKARLTKALAKQFSGSDGGSGSDDDDVCQCEAQHQQQVVLLLGQIQAQLGADRPRSLCKFLVYFTNAIICGHNSLTAGAPVVLGDITKSWCQQAKGEVALLRAQEKDADAFLLLHTESSSDDSLDDDDDADEEYPSDKPVGQSMSPESRDHEQAVQDRLTKTITLVNQDLLKFLPVHLAPLVDSVVETILTAITAVVPGTCTDSLFQLDQDRSAWIEECKKDVTRIEERFATLWERNQDAQDATDAKDNQNDKVLVWQTLEKQLGAIAEVTNVMPGMLAPFGEALIEVIRIDAQQLLAPGAPDVVSKWVEDRAYWSRQMATCGAEELLEHKNRKEVTDLLEKSKTKAEGLQQIVQSLVQTVARAAPKEVYSRVELAYPDTDVLTFRKVVACLTNGGQYGAAHNLSQESLSILHDVCLHKQGSSTYQTRGGPETLQFLMYPVTDLEQVVQVALSWLLTGDRLETLTYPVASV
jgi:hypothetical protein